MTEISTNLSSSEIRTQLWALITGISGRSGAHQTLCNGVKLRIGLTALKLIRDAFDRKSNHEAGDDGIQWAELSPETIARRRLGPGDKQMLKGEGIHPTHGLRPFLSEAQDRRWRIIFASRKSWLQGMHGMSDEAASAQAAQIAWATLKREGAKTKLDVLGSRWVQILKDTGRLAASLSPGIEDPGSFPLDGQAPPPEAVRNSKAADRILRTDEPGVVVVGTAVEYASRCHAKRPLWPANGLPAAWNAQLAKVCGQAIAEAVVMVMQEAA
jgi:hypothetical protein